MIERDVLDNRIDESAHENSACTVGNCGVLNVTSRPDSATLDVQPAAAIQCPYPYAFAVVTVPVQLPRGGYGEVVF
jgi:hypothetical protein